MYFSWGQIPFPRDNRTGLDFYKHLGFYAYKKGFLDTITTLTTGVFEDVEKLEQLWVFEFGFRIKVVVTAHDSPEIDLPEDIKRIEAKRVTGTFSHFGTNFLLHLTLDAESGINRKS